MKIQRQGMLVSPEELRNLADELEKETAKQFGFKFDSKKKWLINIINKTKAIDTWQIENSKKKHKTIERECAVCGKKFKTKIYWGGAYSQGHYFGEMKLQIGKGKDVKVGTTDILGEKYPVTKWTGKHKKVEYWECNACYEDADHEEWLEKNIEKIYGKPCPDYEPDCVACQAWEVYKTILNKHNL